MGDPGDTARTASSRKNHWQFAQAVQGAVKSLMTDGTYKTILEKWNVANGAISTSEIRS
ncbi:hypothetical protein ACQPZQ_44755 [Pseudonocardia sp. CA-142604]|uniref:hypothetical protein n=1 Tax=Pseudonocardia sp. CA-142604 TaxID=3240024 RepID=UPI003D8D6188